MKKRILSLLFALCFLMALVPQTTLSASASTITGNWGGNLTWIYDESTGTLTISGTGDLGEWGAFWNSPWASFQENVKTVEIGYGVTSLCNFAFLGFTGLTSISIPSTVTFIGDDAFTNCNALTSVVIPSSVTYMGTSVFSACSKLSLVAIGNGLRGIPSLGFVGCPELTTLVLGSGIEAIGDAAFSGTNLTDVYYLGNAEDWNSIVIEEPNKELLNATIHYNFDPYEDIIGNPFKDVTARDYFAEPVMWALGAGVTNGTSATTFSPNVACTRGQVVTFLWRAVGSPLPENTVNPFTDIAETDYYYNAVLWAVEEGITNGTGNEKFSPDASCTRGQVATFLWRAYGEPTPTSTNPFTDIAEGDYCYNAVLWAVEEGITNGTGKGLFSPNKDCTRGQIVTFLYRTFSMD